MFRPIAALIVPLVVGAMVTPLKAGTKTEDTVTIKANIPLDKGKPSVEIGVGRSQTRGETKQSVTVSTDLKNVKVEATQTKQGGGKK